MIEVDQQLKPSELPQIQQSHSRATLPKTNIGVERKDSSIVGEIPKRVAVQVVAMSQISREVRIGPVRCDQLDDPAVSSDPMKLAHDRHRVAHVLDNVAANNFIEFIVDKWIRQIV